MIINRNSISFFLILSLLSGYLSAQQPVQSADRILFRGVVIAASSGERLAGSQIFINRSYRTSSKDDGTFSFFAFRLDTIIFTMLGYQHESLLVSDTLKAREFLTGVFLKTDTIEIGEVIILPRLPNLKADMMNIRKVPDPQLENAKSNISNAAYLGRTTPSNLGDPTFNYNYLRQKQNRDAYEKGGIASEKSIALNPFILIPAAYMLLHGLPEAPAPPEPRISQKDMDDLNKLFMESRKEKK
jgi:hypothetical protein